MIKAAAAAFLCLLVSIPTVQAQDPYFDGVTERLDRDGSFFTYFGSEHLVREFEQVMKEGLPALLKLNRQFDEAEPFLQLGTKAYDSSGLASLGGLGMSSTRLPTGVGRTKTVIRQGDGEGEGMVWNVFGKDVLPEVKALPADTEAVFALGLRFDTVLNWLEATTKGSPMEQPFAQIMEGLEAHIDIKRATKELQNLVVSVRLDPEKTFEFPLDGGLEPLTVPLIRAVARATVSGDTIEIALKNFLEELGLETTELEIAGLKAQVLPEMAPSVQPCWVFNDGAIVFATDPGALKDALNPGATDKTLGEQKNFQEHLGSVTGAHAAFYTSPKLSRTFSKIQAEAMKDMEEGAIPPEMAPLMKQLMGGDEPSGTFSTAHQDGKFVEFTTHTTGPKQLKLGVASTAVLAAILVPAVSKVLNDAKKTELKSNGKNLYVMTFADAIDTNAVGFPTTKDGYKGTHEFFKAQNENRILPATPAFVSGPGVPAAENWKTIGAKNCIWQVVLDCDETTDAGTPYLISSNLKIKTLGDDWLANLDRSGPLKGHVVMAFHGAGAEVIRPEELAERQKEILGFGDHMKKITVLKP